MQRITITPSQIHANYIAIEPAQYHYLTRVIRLQTGAQFQAIDGTGTLYLCALTAHGSTYAAEIIQTISPTGAAEQPDLDRQTITLICALPKGNNFDDIVRACTELGVTTIIPAQSDRTLLNPSPQKLQRWRKIAQEAAEQSERLTIPTIAEPQPLPTIFSQLPIESSKYLCEARGEYPHLLSCLQSNTPIPTQIILAIGPEGGWTDAEIDLAIEYNFQLVSLGRHILRTITAPIVALSIVTATRYTVDS
ncbi:16S rRNA (uracil(1498)-N(3))-methyltransferase [Chamaesiphon sp.]|uniref:16S rRNA (uracil(1498)-N(3))-methyltransferase n=1 Tax=Chamaesiphon sp. TaxID=2814140 RepID=UPI003593EEB4